MRAKGERRTERMDVKPRPGQQWLDTAVLTDVRDFAALAEEWEELYKACPTATPFQSWAWLYSWWEHYGEGYEPRLIIVREDGLLVGLLPLMLERRWGFGRLLFVDSGTTDYLDMLAREGWENAVAEAGVTALERMSGWWVADLQGLRPQAAAWALHRGWSGPKISLWQFNCPVIEVRPWNELLASLSKNRRGAVRSTLRRAEADGVRCELAKPADAEDAARRLVALSREQWQGHRLTSPIHWTRRFEAHLEAAVRRMTTCGLGGISEFRRGGEVVASQFLVFGRDFVGYYMVGASQEALRRYQVSSLYIWDAMNFARAHHSTYLDLLEGEEPYKLRWASGVVSTHRLVLGRNRASWVLYAGYQALRSKAKSYAYSEGAPEWVKNAADAYIALRYVVNRYMEQVRSPWLR